MSAEKWYPFDANYIRIMRLLLPFAVTFLNTPQSLGGLTPIFLGFLPFLFVVDLRKKINYSQPLGDLLIAALPTLTVWICAFFTVMEIRYVFFLWIILYLPVTEAVVSVFENKSLPFQKLSVALVYALLGFSIIRAAFTAIETYSPLDEQGNPQCHHFIFCDYLKPINDAAPQGVRVLTLNAYRYYLRTDLLACSTVSDEYQALHDASFQSADEFWEEVYRQGYTYIAYEHEYTMRHLHVDFIPSAENAPAWMELEQIYHSDPEIIAAYKINIVGEPPVRVEKTCAQNNEIWEPQNAIP
jgi:hypothetical protein